MFDDRHQTALADPRHSLTLAVIVAGALAFGCGGSQESSRQPGPNAAPGTAPAQASAPAWPTTISPLTATERTPPTLRLPDHAATTRYALELTIDPDSPVFSGVVHIDVELRQPARVLWLNGLGLLIDDAAMELDGVVHTLSTVSAPATRGRPGSGTPGASPDRARAKAGARLAPETGFIGLRLPPEVVERHRKRHPEPLRARLTLRYRGQFLTMAQGGLFTVEHGGDSYVFSHLEPLDARTAIPCFDEPRFKVPWQLTLHVKDGNVALTNTPLVASRPGERGGYTTHEFAPSKPLPSYLLAIAVGPLDIIDIGAIGRAQTPTRIIVPRGRSADASYAKVTIPRVLTWLEDYFDMAYPYAKFDHVAIPGMGGAMEHPGLITYGARILLTDNGRRTDQFDSYHNMVVAHEIAHQWFGNLVTLAWWNDLWLNESFATWMASKVQRSLESAWDSDIHDARQLAWTKQTDGRAQARSLRRPITSDEDIEGAFDTISYGKGGAVLTMFERWVGEDAFRAGVRAYISEHAWGTSTSDDFLAALSEAANPAIADAFRTFLTQPGIPLVTAELMCPTRATPTLSLTQKRFLASGAPGAAQRFSVPVCVRYGRARTSHTQCQLLTDETAVMTLTEARRCPTWVVANADSAGYYRVAYSRSMRRKLFGQQWAALSTLERLTLIDDTLALARKGDIAIDEVLPLASGLARSKNPHLVAASASIAGLLRSDFVRDELQDAHARFIQRTFGRRARALGWQASAGEPSGVSELREHIVPLVAEVGADRQLRAEARRLLQAWLDSGLKYSQTLDATIAHKLHIDALSAALADAPDDLYNRVVDAFTAERDDRRHFVLGLALSKTDRLDRLQAHWQKILDGTYAWRDAWLFLHYPFMNPRTRTAAVEFAVGNFATITNRLPERWRVRTLTIFSRLCDDGHRERIASDIAPSVSNLPGGTQMISEVLTDIGECVAARARQQPGIESFLRAVK